MLLKAHTFCKPVLSCQNALKFTYRSLEFQNFPWEDPWTPAFWGGEGKREGETGENGLEGG